MVATINPSASDDASVLAWAASHQHPEDVGVTLSAADRAMIVQMADLGGQYYSRFNVDPMWNSAGY